MVFKTEHEQARKLELKIVDFICKMSEGSRQFLPVEEIKLPYADFQILQWFYRDRATISNTELPTGPLVIMGVKILCEGEL